MTTNSSKSITIALNTGKRVAGEAKGPLHRAPAPTGATTDSSSKNPPWVVAGVNPQDSVQEELARRNNSQEEDEDTDDALADLAASSEEEDADSESSDRPRPNDDEPDDELEATLDTDEINSGVLEVYSENCLKCKHLVPHADKKWNSCHFSKGNKRCPASSVQILIGIPLDAIVTAFVNAEHLGDNGRLANLYSQLATKPAWQQQRIQDELSKRRASNAAAAAPKSKK